MNLYRTVGACALTLAAVALSAATAQAATIPEDFEDYTSTTDLQNDFAQPIPNDVTITLSDNLGVNGSQALLFEGDASGDGIVQAELLLTQAVELTGIDQVTLQVKALEGNSRERFVVQLKDEFGNTLAEGPVDNSITTQSLPTDSFFNYVIDTTNPSNNFAWKKVSINFTSFDSNNGFGSSSVVIDNITTIPEPASLALLAMAGASVLGFRRRS